MELIKSYNILSSKDIMYLENVNKNNFYSCSPLTQSSGFTLLMHLVSLKNKYLDIVIKKYLKEYPQEIDKVNERGWTALMIAARNCNTYKSLNILNLLLKLGANINLQEKCGWTVLHYVVNNFGEGYDEICLKILKLLLEFGADVNLTELYGRTALMMFMDRSNIAPVKLLLEYDSKPEKNKKYQYIVTDISLLNKKN